MPLRIHSRIFPKTLGLAVGVYSNEINRYLYRTFKGVYKKRPRRTDPIFNPARRTKLNDKFRKVHNRYMYRKLTDITKSKEWCKQTANTFRVIFTVYTIL